MVLPKYRLELHWESVSYPDDSLAVLDGAYFTGPVLKDSAELRDADSLILDMTSQHVVFTPMEDYYHGVLSWKGVQYRGSNILLTEANVRGKYVNALEALAHSDWILIDCIQHEEARHPFSLVYTSKVMTSEGQEKF